MPRYARKSIYDSRQFDSTLELNAYKHLQLLKIDFTFHENTFVLQKSYKLDTFNQTTKKIYKASIQPIKYTPEFRLESPLGLIIYIEMKGFEEGVFKIKWKLFRKSLKENERAFLIKSVGDLQTVLQIFNIGGRIDPQKFQQQFDL